MTAVAVIGPQQGLYKDRGPIRGHTYWHITWRGPCGSWTSGVAYSSRQDAERMAREGGAKEIVVEKEAAA